MPKKCQLCPRDTMNTCRVTIRSMVYFYRCRICYLVRVLNRLNVLQRIKQRTATMGTALQPVISYWKDSTLCFSIVSQEYGTGSGTVAHWDDDSTKDDIATQIRGKYYDQSYHLCIDVARQKSRVIRTDSTSRSTLFPDRFGSTLVFKNRSKPILGNKGNRYALGTKPYQSTATKRLFEAAFDAFSSLWEYETQQRRGSTFGYWL